LPIVFFAPPVGIDLDVPQLGCGGWADPAVCIRPTAWSKDLVDIALASSVGPGERQIPVAGDLLGVAAGIPAYALSSVPIVAESSGYTAGAC
jgi:hypothetical protein